ncbi:MAG: peptidyl-prolyl cis-trans isomerase [Vicinamibacterales bacterium]
MKKLIAAALVLGLAVPPAALLAQQAEPGRQIIQRIVVKVNGEALTQTELERRQIDALRAANPQLQTTNINDARLREQLAQVTPKVLTDAVDELLLLQRGRELGFSMSDEQFKTMVDGVKKEYNLNDEQLLEALKNEMGMTSLAEWRQFAERSVIIQTVQSREIMSKTTLTEAEQKAYYDQHPDEFLKSPTVTLREVFVAVPTEMRAGQSVVNVAASEAAQAKIDAARDRLLKGEDVETVVKEVSESPSKDNGGLVGPVNLTDMDPAIRQKLEPLKAGEVSEVIRSARGLVIFKVETKTAAEKRPFDEVRNEVYQKIMSERVSGETRKYLEKMRANALIEWKDDTLKKLYEQGRAQQDSGRP